MTLEEFKSNESLRAQITQVGLLEALDGEIETDLTEEELLNKLIASVTKVGVSDAEPADTKEKSKEEPKKDPKEEPKVESEEEPKEESKEPEKEPEEAGTENEESLPGTVD